ncbi:oxygenase MpaB family protein [Sphingomicrobium sp. XHP0239]|uniref:oxygenase MpaB family protein n=1 Tax=Sphingomicrobium maritimum TaxID=3133972 RepID=UPI0031CCA35B
MPSEFVRQRLIAHVRGVFNEEGQQPVPPSDAAWFAKDTPIRLVHADIVGMMVGGVRGLLLQMLHPHALQGVLDYSDFRADMHGRLRRTARFIAVTTFGHRDEAQAAVDRVNRIHQSVAGTLPGGAAYRATDPRVLAWVHVVEAQSFLAGYQRYVRPRLTGAERDRYFDQFALVADKLGADPVPRSAAEADAIFRDLRSDLATSAKTREVARLVLSQNTPGTPAIVQRMIMAEAVALLPPFARDMLGLDRSLLALPARVGTAGAARTLRWAFRQGYRTSNPD